MQAAHVFQCVNPHNFHELGACRAAEVLPQHDSASLRHALHLWRCARPHLGPCGSPAAPSTGRLPTNGCTDHKVPVNG